MNAKKPTKAMLRVRDEFFAGDWQAMTSFAKRYDPNQKKRDVELGKRFRDIIGTRNRHVFWKSVDQCTDVTASGEIIADGDSLSAMQRAIQRCADGISVTIQIDGKTIGRLIPNA